MNRRTRTDTPSNPPPPPIVIPQQHQQAQQSAHHHHHEAQHLLPSSPRPRQPQHQHELLARILDRGRGHAGSRVSHSLPESPMTSPILSPVMYSLPSSPFSARLPSPTYVILEESIDDLIAEGRRMESIALAGRGASGSSSNSMQFGAADMHNLHFPPGVQNTTSPIFSHTPTLHGSEVCGTYQQHHHQLERSRSTSQPTVATSSTSMMMMMTTPTTNMVDLTVGKIPKNSEQDCLPTVAPLQRTTDTWTYSTAGQMAGELGVLHPPPRFKFVEYNVGKEARATFNNNNEEERADNPDNQQQQQQQQQKSQQVGDVEAADNPNSQNRSAQSDQIDHQQEGTKKTKQKKKKKKEDANPRKTTYRPRPRRRREYDDLMSQWKLPGR